MDRLTARLEALEGRVIAHRRILQQLVTLGGADLRQKMLLWLDERAVMQDAEEDPGVLPIEAAALELALADEMRLLHAALAERS
ncbi:MULTISPECIES: hypothetical protein [unclassified Paracoccus (in: a-proteobacteria)]|uniref:hypothetical protein n=1 Tax=unclassified Paracoccus (in: a-proteobacteria) TaxID=2688777 RepID=UPI0012B402BC|nr:MULTISPECIES: hypothetical protein [unclassified Paracoccus (in: a-proteobacteria)]UXU76550.1 hypothetical protein GB879_014345 [Paracoccus sp. SMMA_5]UXU82383.1 hypothetical protein GB880_014090 [Paracoccus sp. SMMA_5_TC]